MDNGSAFNRRTFLLTASLLAGAGVLAGCSATTSTGATAGASAGTATKVKTINFYSNVMGEAAQKPAWATAISLYTAKYGTTVNPVIFPYAQAATQMVLYGKSGKFMGVGTSAWQVLLPMNVLADLTAEAKGLGIPQKALDAFTVKGVLYSIPTTAAGIGQIVNGEVAKSVGLKSGLSTDQFATVLEEIKKSEPSMIPYAAVTKPPDLKDIAMWMMTFGSPVVTDAMKCTIGDAESVMAMKWYKGLQDQGLIKANVARNDARILFSSGRTAMYDDAPLASSFVVTNGAAQSIVDNISAIARPTYKGGESFNRFWGNSLYASKGVGETSSRDFIRFLSTDVAAATALFENSGVAPASATVAAKIPDLAKNAFQNAFRTEVSEHSVGTVWDTLPVGPQIDTAIGAGVANILAGQVDVQSGLNSLKSNVQSILDSVA